VAPPLDEKRVPPPPPAAAAAAAAAASQHGAFPCLSFRMDRKDIHRDVLAVVLRAAAEQLLEGPEAR